MIRSFRDAEAEKIFRQQFSKRFRAIQNIALRKLVHLNRAITLRDLAAIPGNQLEALKRERKGQHSIRMQSISTDSAFDGPMQTPSMLKITDYH